MSPTGVALLVPIEAASVGVALLLPCEIAPSVVIIPWTLAVGVKLGWELIVGLLPIAGRFTIVSSADASG